MDYCGQVWPNLRKVQKDGRGECWDTMVKNNVCINCHT